MKAPLPWSFFTLLLFALATPCVAQVPVDSLVVIKTIDGNTFYGTVQSDDQERIVIKTDQLGEVAIRKTAITSLELVKPQQLVNGKFWYKNKFAAHYFMGLSGHSLRKGEGYYQNTWLLVSQLRYGITDHFSVKVGIIPLTLFDELSTSPVLIQPHFTFPSRSEKHRWSIGMMYMSAIGAGVGVAIGENITLAYGAYTTGTPQKHLTFAVGLGSNTITGHAFPATMLSGMLRVGRKTYLLFESYFFVERDAFFDIIENYPILLAALGGRSAGERLGFDYGLGVITSPTYDEVAPFPWLGLNIKLGRN